MNKQGNNKNFFINFVMAFLIHRSVLPLCAGPDWQRHFGESKGRTLS
jgi:hypothetical protein